MNISESNKAIIDQLAAGKVYKEIGAEMGLKTRTIKDRVRVLKQKYKCTTVAQLVIKCQGSNGLSH